MALVACSFLLLTAATLVSNEIHGNSNDKHLEIYKKLFALKRKEQIQTAEQVWVVNDYAKQYKTIKFLMETIFPILNQSLLEASEMNYIAGDPFPDKQENREVLGKIYENVMFFGDVLLRMPDITKKMYNEHKSEWQSILEEAIQFCNATKGLFTGPHGTQLHLMAQEIGILPEEEDYVNPYRAAKSQQQENLPSSSKKKKKSRLARGPKLRGLRTEL